MSNLLKRGLSLLMVLCMVLALVPGMASAADDSADLYLKPNGNWASAGAWFAVSYWGNQSGWVKMADSNYDGVYEATIPTDITGFAFVRMDPASSEMSWDNKWNQTGDLTIPTDGTNMYTVTDGAWDCYDGTWSVYTYVEPVYIVAGSGALCGSNWDVTDEANRLTDPDGDYIYTKSYAQVAADVMYEFKVAVDKSWSVAYPGDNFTFTLDAVSDVTISFNVATKEISYTTGHNYDAGVQTTAPGCTTEGVKTFTCTICGDTYTEEISATGHSYENGACTVCGEADPDAVEPGYVLVTNAADITAGGQFVIVANNGGAYKALGTTIASKIAAVDVSVSDNMVTGTSLPVWTIETATGGVALSVDGSYLAYKSSTNFQTATSAYAWSVTAGSNGGFIFNSAATDTERGIYYQKSSDRFGAYAQSNANASGYISELLVFKYTEGGAAAPCEHSYTSEVTAPTCTEGGYTTYTCSKCGDSYTDDVTEATGHNYVNGVCSVCGEADPDAVVGCTWTKVALSDIKPSDVIAITMTKDGTTWALSNANGTSKAPTAVVVTVNGSTMTSINVEDLSWNISNSNGILTIYVAGSTDTWLYATNTNNGVRVGTNDNKTWEIDSNSGYLKHVGTSRYMGVYTTNPDWRVYTNTTGNTAGQTLSFWKLNGGDHEHTHTPSYVAGKDATCTEDGNIAYWYCSDETCPNYGTCYEDETLTKVITSDVVLPATGHRYTNGKCACGDTQIVTLKGSFDGWTDGYNMVWGENGVYTYTIDHWDAAEYKFKIKIGDNWYGNNGTFTDSTNGQWSMSTSDDNCTLKASGGSYTFSFDITTNMLTVTAELDHVHDLGEPEYDWSDYYTLCMARYTCQDTSCGQTFSYGMDVVFETVDGKLKATASCTVEGETVTTAQTIDPVFTNAVYFDNSSTNWTQVHAYCWGGNGAMNGWPGTQMTKVEGYDELYVIVVPDGYDNIIFSNGSGAQTVDLTIQTSGQNVAVCHTNIIVENKYQCSWGYVEPSKHTITWNACGETKETNVYYGATPVCPFDTLDYKNGCAVFTFSKWDQDIVAVTGDAIYTAQYTRSNSHTGELEYTHVNEFSHKVTWSCCGAVVSEEAEHEDWDEDGYCVCGDVYIRIYVNYAKIFGIEVEDGSIDIFVKPGTTYTTDIAPADGWQKVCVEIYDYSANTVDATPNATQLVLGPEYTSAYNKDLQIYVSSYWDIIYDLNGGDITDELKDFIPEGVYDSENGILTLYMPCDAYTSFDALKAMYFVREGYTLIGVTDGQITYTGDEIIAPNGEDLHLTLVWKADHVCSENLTEVEAVEPDCDTNGVKAYWSCSCGKYYADANASTEIPDLAAWKNGDGKIEKLGHGHTAGLYYEEDDENHHTVYCNDCDAAIKGNVKCTDTIGDGDHKCDFCPNENITGHSYDPATHECECGALETFTVTWLFNGGVMDEQWKQQLISEGFTVTDTSVSGTFPYDDFAPHAPGVTKDGYILIGYTDQYGKFNEGQEIFTLTENMTYTMVWEAKTYTLTVETVNGNVELTVPYGANLLEALAQAAAEGKIPAKGDWIRVNDEKTNGEYYIVGSYYFVPSYSFVENNSTMPAENVTLLQGPHTYGWTMVDTDGDYAVDSWQYCDPEKGMLGEGWHYIEEDYDDVPGGAWYYFQHKLYSDVRVEGLNRVPYPTVAINGITYGPNPEDLVNADKYGYTDATSSLFVFGEDGKFDQSTGVIHNEDNSVVLHYAINGQLPWHIGFVQVGSHMYYFIGANEKAVGDTYVSRAVNVSGFVVNGVYTFGEDGNLCRYKGITKMADGTLRYYSNYRLMMGAGLVQVDDNYIYVRSNGELVVNAEYYVPANELGVPKGIYYFDADGFLVMPEEEPGKNGFYFEDGNWFYYVDGAKAYCAGLINTTGKLWYETADAEGVENQGWVYVKSNGALAIGEYYVTNVNGHETIASGDKCVFGDDCLMQIAKNGIIDGYYYENNQIAYAAGLVEVNGSYYYVRSNGQIVVGQNYWITNVNDTGVVQGWYEFDENGIMLNAETEVKNGVVDGYYYEDGKIAYAAGLIEIESGKFIYVRSNGQLATGLYWTTNHNGALAEGLYDFGEDGILVIE